MFSGASLVEPFYFTPFDIKRLQMAPEAVGEAVPNGAIHASMQRAKRGWMATAGAIKE